MRTRRKRRGAGRGLLTAVLTLLILAAIGAAAYFLYPMFLPKIDPFEYGTVSFEGVSGNGTARMVPLTDRVGADFTKIEYVISKSAGLNQGEVVTVTAKSRSYNLVQKEKDFTVAGLDEKLTDVKLLGEESIKILNAKAESLMELNMGDPNDAFGVKNELISSEPARIYLLANPDGSNILYHLIKTKFRTSAGEEKLVFLASYFTNVMYNKDADGKISFESCNYIGDDVLIGSDVVYDSYITGYPSLKKAKQVLVDEQRTGKTVTSIKMN